MRAPDDNNNDGDDDSGHDDNNNIIIINDKRYNDNDCRGDSGDQFAPSDKFNLAREIYLYKLILHRARG